MREKEAQISLRKWSLWPLKQWWVWDRRTFLHLIFHISIGCPYNSPFDVTMATSDATVMAPKLGYKMRVFPALVWNLNTLFIPWQSISHSIPRERRLCLGQLLTYNPHTGSISLPTVGAVQQLEKDLMLALYLSPTSDHSPSWARTCLTCAGCPWRSLVRVLFIFVCALVCTCGHTCQS